ncbi:hypothetical protein DW892_05610 [Collinsella sp. AM40-7AC]|uniref:hypothetical protein n=1 Tax=Collinsella TaxID=102106 RepID=UPI000E500BEC|nr:MULTISPECIES: hypothetical protein [Collinsella]RHB18269.1 hypothetical protein DW892_05610 [Collinsella sp. AM40-7AC]
MEEQGKQQDAECEQLAKSKSLVKNKLVVAAIALACAVALVTGGYFTYSAYTANGFLKSVAATGTAQSLFASDLLTGYMSTPSRDELDRAQRSVTVYPSSEQCSFTFSIYNYLLSNSNFCNDKNVTYTLTVEGYGLDGATWSYSPRPSGSVTLPENQPTKNDYTVTFPEDKLGHAYFVIRATVVSGDSPGTELTCLAAKVVPSKRAEAKTAAVEGALVDEAGKFADYAAYNYRVTVTGAPANVTLTWGENVEIDPFFETNHGVTADKTNHTVTFTMEPGSLVVNFYRADGKTPDGWDKLGISVSGTTQTGTTETQ